MRQISILSAVMLTIMALWPSPSFAQSDTSVTGAAGGIYPPGTTLNGVPINGLKTGFGLVIASDGSASGQFHTLLLGISLLGQKQNISVNGNADTGSQAAGNIATFSGKCTIDMGDGSPPTPTVPFTVTVTTNSSDQGSLGLLLGLTTLPDATINSGSMNIIK
jgi:hypothetical protein